MKRTTIGLQAENSANKQNSCETMIHKKIVSFLDYRLGESYGFLRPVRVSGTYCASSLRILHGLLNMKSAHGIPNQSGFGMSKVGQNLMSLFRIK